MKTYLLGLSIGCALLGCSGDKPSEQTKVDYSQLKATTQSDSRLNTPAKTTTETHLKNGLRLQLSQTNYLRDLATAGATDNPGPVSGAGSSNFSTTNVHINGVDEADVAKYDGTYWFWAANYQRGMRIFKAGSDSKPALISEQPAGKQVTTEGIYLQQTQGKTTHVVSLNSEYGNIGPIWMPGINVGIARPAVVSGAAIDIALPVYYRPQNGKLIIEWSDVGQPETPKVTDQLTIQGRLMNSRKIGDVLYVFTRFDPWLDELKPAETNSAQRDANEQLLQKTALTDLLPKYHFNQQADKPLTDNCMLPAAVDSHQGFPSLVHITAVDLKTKALLGSTCINAPMQNFTMNGQHAFLTALAPGLNGDNKTLIHQFTLGDKGPTYSATGSVPGYISGDLSFWLDEKDGVVRVLSSDLSNQDTQHRLTLLKEQNGELRTISQLPNAQQPEKIGKPGESIYGARFVGDKAYVVTFRRTDPLYVIDVKTPTEPKIVGELQVPGFATYLHPVGENYLFSLGQNADENGRVTGIKTELIDVSNPAKPTSVRSLLFGSNAANAEALYDLHAVAVLPQENGDMRFAFSINNYDQNYAWQYTGVHLFAVSDVASGQAKLSLAGVMAIETRSSQQQSPKYYGNGRTMLHGDAIYFGTSGTIWSGNWNTPNQFKGPIPAEPGAGPQLGFDGLGCPAVYRDGVQVQVTSAATNACKATITARADGYSEVLKADSSAAATSCNFRGLAERPGYYTLDVSLEGMPVQSKTLVLVADRCNVITQNLAFKF
jgi:hypothetical protein